MPEHDLSARKVTAGGNFELFAWFFMRISGLVLVLLVLGHVALMHIVNSVDEIDYGFVAARWTAGVGWRLYDFFLLFFALLHGANGVRGMIDDYLHAPGWRTVAVSGLYLVTFVVFMAGTVVLFTFQPPPAGPAGG